MSTGEIALENRDIATATHQVSGVGSVILMQIDQLVEGDWQRLLGDRELLHQLRLSKETIAQLYEALEPNAIAQLAKQLSDQRIQVVMYGEAGYPSALTEIDSPPFLLYGLGDIDLLNNEDAIGIVGTRVPSSYGKMVAHRLAADLATLGWTVVSGMAAGIDADAHRGARSVHGKTIAVLGCGVNVIFPKENTKLYHDLIEHGLVISEYPPDMQPHKGLFPQRNRIISGLSRGIVVVESHSRSGSLITATWALEQGREVFAVPGSILSAKSAGPHRLIKEGAKLVTAAHDIIDELNYPAEIVNVTSFNNEPRVSLTEDEQELLGIISYAQIHIDELFLSTSIERGRIHQSLMTLEAKKQIRKLPGYYYVKA